MKPLKNVEIADFEDIGYETRLETETPEQTKEICALRIHELERRIEPDLRESRVRFEEVANRDRALHAFLYDRPVPVNDAAMLVRSAGGVILFAIAVTVAVASLAGNVAVFQLFGFGPIMTVLFATGATVLPLAVGHLAYEKIIASNKGLQVALILGALALCILGLIQLGQARKAAIDRATSHDTVSSYVDGGSPESPGLEPEKSTSEPESKSRETLGRAMFTMLIAADLMLGFLAGLLIRLRSDHDHAAWQELKKIRAELQKLERELAEYAATIEIAKARCMAGILRAEAVLRHRRRPYYKALKMIAIVAVFVSGSTRPLSAQPAEHYEAILIDTSRSIAHGPNGALFPEYLAAVRHLLLTEPASSRVWVSVISTDSFGGPEDLIRGWTPGAHGVFTDDLTQARRQLAANFETKSRGLAPVAKGTDILGALWRGKAAFESDPKSGTATKEIWIFSDMMNETVDFPMPSLLSLGPEQMLEQARVKRLVVPLKGYRLHMAGVSTDGISPQSWLTVKRFWVGYFAAAEAEVVSYSTGQEVARD